jgi:hypothetical protein
MYIIAILVLPAALKPLIHRLIVTFHYTKVYSGTLGKIIAKSVEQSISEEAASATASQQIVRILWKWSSSPSLQEQATCSGPELDKSNKRSHYF